MSCSPTPNDPTRGLGLLVGDVARLLRREFESRVQHLGLTQGQWRVLGRLARCEGVNQATLADLLEIQPITLTRQLDRLEAAGWVERRPDPADRRAVRLFLTPRAQPLLAELHAIGEVILGLALDGIPEDRRSELAGMLGRMRENLLTAVDRSTSPAARTGTDG